MADTESIDNSAAPPPSESENPAALTTMEDHTTTKDAKTEAEKNPGGVSLRIWPPTQKTRDAVVNRLIETLSTPTILSKRYGTLPQEDATAVAKSIEEEAYGVASAAVSGDDDGIEILQVYSKEISKRMLESVKARAPATADNKIPGSEAESGEDAGVGSTDAAKEDASPESEKAEA